MRKPIRFLLFLSSYVPLFVICGLAQNDNEVLGAYERFGFKVLSLVLFGLAVLGVLAAYILVLKPGDAAKTSLHVASISKDSQGTLAYLVTYLVPFITLDFDGVHALVANALLLGFIGVLYIQSDMTYLNPTLNLFGYQAYRMKLENSTKEKVLLAKNAEEAGGIIKASLVGKGVYIKHDR